MADVESAGELARDILVNWAHYERNDPDYDVDLAAWFARIEARDAAIRQAARREAFEEAARWCESRSADTRRDADAQTPRWVVPLGVKAKGFAEAAEHFRALATGKGAG